VTRRPGFTLIEVLVAVLLTGVVALMAHTLFSAAVGGLRAVDRADVELARDMNARRWLRAAMLSAEAGQGGDGPFEGRPGSATFSAMIATPDGWPELRTVRLARAGRRFVAAAGGSAVVLAEPVDDVAFDYLVEPGADARWATTWISPVSLPLAIRVRTLRRVAGRAVADTALYLVKARG
jgi:prepilin-type N-terminal cleavage/methylation domain-containing protein